MGTLDSNAINADVNLESPGVSILRTLGFAPRPAGGSGVGGEYWSGSREAGAGTDRVLRHYYDPSPGVKKWVRENRNGVYSGVHYISTKTDRFKRLYAGYGAITTSSSTRRIETDPPANMSLCINLGGGSPNAQVVGAAPDPNPGSTPDPTRDIVYFAWRDTSAGTEYVKRVTVDGTGCTSTILNDFGGRGGVWSWPVGWW